MQLQSTSPTDQQHMVTTEPYFTVSLKKVAKQFSSIKSHKDENPTCTQILQILCDLFKEKFPETELKDVTIFDAGKKFYVIKTKVLTQESDILQKELQEKSKDTPKIAIEINEKGFGTFIKSLHCKDASQVITDKNVVDLFTLALRYRIKRIAKACTQFFSENVNHPNIDHMVALATKHAEQILKGIRAGLQNS